MRNFESTLDFILTAFPEWRVRGKGENVWYGRERHWVHVGDDDYYLSLNDNTIGENRDLKGHSTGLAHIAFAVDDIDALVERLLAKGYDLKQDLRKDHPFRKNVYFYEPEGYEIEFVEYLSDVSAEKNRYDDIGTTTVTFADP